MPRVIKRIGSRVRKSAVRVQALNHGAAGIA